MSVQNSEYTSGRGMGIQSSIDHDTRTKMPSPLIVSLAMLSGAGFLYLLMLYNIVPAQAIDGNVVTMALAAVGVACSIYGWTSILSGKN